MKQIILNPILHIKKLGFREVILLAKDTQLISRGVSECKSALSLMNYNQKEMQTVRARSTSVCSFWILSIQIIVGTWYTLSKYL